MCERQVVGKTEEIRSGTTPLKEVGPKRFLNRKRVETDEEPRLTVRTAQEKQSTMNGKRTLDRLLSRNE